MPDSENAVDKPSSSTKLPGIPRTPASQDFDAGKAVKRKISDIGLVAALDRNTKRLDELIRAGFKVHGAGTDVAVLLTQLKDALKAVRESHEITTKEHVAEMRAHHEAMTTMITETKALRESTDQARAAIEKQNRLLAARNRRDG